MHAMVFCVAVQEAPVCRGLFMAMYGTCKQALARFLKTTDYYQLKLQFHSPYSIPLLKTMRICSIKTHDSES